MLIHAVLASAARAIPHGSAAPSVTEGVGIDPSSFELRGRQRRASPSVRDIGPPSAGRDGDFPHAGRAVGKHNVPDFLRLVQVDQTNDRSRSRIGGRSGRQQIAHHRHRLIRRHRRKVGTRTGGDVSALLAAGHVNDRNVVEAVVTHNQELLLRCERDSHRFGPDGEPPQHLARARLNLGNRPVVVFRNIDPAAFPPGHRHRRAAKRNRPGNLACLHVHHVKKPGRTIRNDQRVTTRREGHVKRRAIRRLLRGARTNLPTQPAWQNQDTHKDKKPRAGDEGGPILHLGHSYSLSGWLTRTRGGCGP